MLNFVFKAHRLNLKAGTTDSQKIFAMLKLIPQADAAHSRPPLALALILDTSSSMREFADQKKVNEEIERRGMQGSQVNTSDGSYSAFDLKLPTKLDHVIEAALALVEDGRLQSTDRLTVIHFDDDAKTLLPLAPMGDRQAARAAIQALRDCSGGTHMAKGLKCALQQLGDVPPQVAKRALVLTDGQTFDEPECRPLAEQLGASNTPIVAMGVGDENYNGELMIDLVEASSGRPYHLKSMADFRKYMDEELGSSVREVVTDLRATVSAVKGVNIDRITRIYPSLSEQSLSEHPYRLGNIMAGDFTVFLLELTISGLARPPSRVRLVRLGLAGHVPGLGRRDELPPEDLFVNFTADDVAAAAVDKEVMDYVQQRNVDRMVQDAVRQATVDPGRARQTLMVARGMTERLGNRFMTQALDGAMLELDSQGTISGGTRKTMALGGRTKTVKAGGGSPVEGSPSTDEMEAELRNAIGD